MSRFREPLDPKALKFSTSIHVDRKLFREDIEGSIAHVEMLGSCGILTATETKKIVKGLQDIRKEIEKGVFVLSADAKGDGRFVLEDVHMAIEHRLAEKIGPVAGKLHTGRSRNDQVALDERLYLRTTIHAITGAIRGFQKAILGKAEEYRDVIMPGYTHLQRAQPVLLAHHLTAYIAMLDRDHQRLNDCLKRAAVSPLGAAALAGTPYPIDRNAIAEKLGLHDIVENSIDAVTDRDSLLEFISACAIIMMHLSRFAEELILWTTQEWHFASIGDAFTTGSSIMPQKKNPDMAELIRGKTGRVYGDLMALLTTMKGLPLAYNRDMQEDKEGLFDAADTTFDCLDIFARMFATITFDRERFTEELSNDFLLATELADYLVRKGMPFREAHGVVGAIVADCQEKSKTLPDLTISEYKKYSKLFGPDVSDALDLRTSLTRKASAGSTSPKEVGKALKVWRRKLG